MLNDTVGRQIEGQQYGNGEFSITFDKQKVITGKVTGTNTFEISVPLYIIEKMKTEWYGATCNVMSDENTTEAIDFLTL